MNLWIKNRHKRNGLIPEGIHAESMKKSHKTN